MLCVVLCALVARAACWDAGEGMSARARQLDVHAATEEGSSSKQPQFMLAQQQPPPPAELTTLWVLTSCSASLSFLSSSILSTALLRHGIQTRADALLLILVLGDMCSSFSMLFGRAFVPEFTPDDSVKPSLPCVVQANSIEFFGTISILWMAVMSLS